MLGCGSIVRGRKRKKVDSRPFFNYIIEEEKEAYGRNQLRPSTTSVSMTQYPNHIYTKPLLVHDSIANRVPQTAPLLGTRYYLRNSSRLPGITATIPVPADLLELKISESLKSPKFFTDLPDLRNLQVFHNLSFLPSKYPDI